MRLLRNDEPIKAGDFFFIHGASKGFEWHTLTKCPGERFIGNTINRIKAMNAQEYPNTKFMPIIIVRPSLLDRISKTQPKPKGHNPWDKRRRIA